MPGMNVVIRSLVKCLEQEYGVEELYGARYGYHGLANDPSKWKKLTSAGLNGVQDLGGSILGVQGPRAKMQDVVDKLVQSGTTQVYLIGGTGTLRAAQQLKELIRQ